MHSFYRALRIIPGIMRKFRGVTHEFSDHSLGSQSNVWGVKNAPAPQGGRQG